MLDLWFDYIPSILRVGLALEAASLMGGDGADAYRDRMNDWREGIRVAIARLADDDHLSLAWDVDTATDWTWALVHPTNVQHLTGERGWTRTDTSRRIIESLERELLRTRDPDH
jgi:hypothetical protein